MPRLLRRLEPPDALSIDRARPQLVDALLVEGCDTAAARRAYIRQQNAIRQQAEHLRTDPPLLIGGRLTRPERELSPPSKPGRGGARPPRQRDMYRHR